MEPISRIWSFAIGGETVSSLSLAYPSACVKPSFDGVRLVQKKWRNALIRNEIAAYLRQFPLGGVVRL